MGLGDLLIDNRLTRSAAADDLLHELGHAIWFGSIATFVGQVLIELGAADFAPLEMPAKLVNLLRLHSVAG
jgi:hypothetical protein